MHIASNTITQNIDKVVLCPISTQFSAAQDIHKLFQQGNFQLQYRRIHFHVKECFLGDDIVTEWTSCMPQTFKTTPTSFTFQPIRRRRRQWLFPIAFSTSLLANKLQLSKSMQFRTLFHFRFPSRTKKKRMLCRCATFDIVSPFGFPSQTGRWMLILATTQFPK